MFLYYGGTEIVTKPEIKKDDAFLDFGIGFYTTSSFEEAERWARAKMQMNNVRWGYVTIYEFDAEKAEKELSIKSFNAMDEEWLAFVVNNRKGNIADNETDMHTGPVADDNACEFIQLLETGVYDAKYIIEKLKAGIQYTQLVLHNTKALEYLSFFGVKKIK